MKLSTFFAPGLFLMLLGACVDDSSVGRRFDDSREAFNQAYCVCAAMYGQTEEECREDVRGDQYTETQRRCLDDVVAAQPQAVRDAFECSAIDAMYGYAACVEELRACDAEGLDACRSAHAADVQACGELGRSLDDEVWGCN